MINIQSLSSLLKILKENRIRCGIGGSFLLQLNHLHVEPEDVDFWVDPDDIQKVRELFKNCVEIKEKLQLPEKYHFKFLYMDIIVDFVACFITKPNKMEFYYNIRPESIEMITTEDGLVIPCTSLEDWYIVYKLLNREKKAELIKEFLYKEKKIQNKESIEKTYNKLNNSMGDKENVLPKRVKSDVYKFLENSIQMSINEIYNLGSHIDD